MEHDFIDSHSVIYIVLYMYLPKHGVPRWSRYAVLSSLLLR